MNNAGNFTKICRIGVQPEIGSTFIKIQFKDGKLSITGVEGPLQNGDAKGACGQINTHEWNFKEFAPGWDKEKVQGLHHIWEEWHLNDMKAGCEHQVGPEWEHRNVKLYEFRLTMAAINAQAAAKKASREALEKGETFTPTPEQTRLANLKYSLKGITETPPSEDYVLSDKTETKSTDWLTPAEHPDGFLTKPCPICGYKYGTKWLFREVPTDVVEWLKALPDTDIKPAWV